MGKIVSPSQDRNTSQYSKLTIFKAQNIVKIFLAPSKIVVFAIVMASWCSEYLVLNLGLCHTCFHGLCRNSVGG